MKTSEFCGRLAQTVPQMPPLFDQAMRDTLDGIVAREQIKAPKARTFPKRRVVAVLLAAILLLAAVAVAADWLKQNVFEATLGDSPDNGARLMQNDLASVSFDECDVTVKQAAYDGVSLYVVYSVRDRNATAPVEANASGQALLSAQTMSAMERDGVGWWCDAIWIDGEAVDMPSLSSGMTVGSETDGELLFYLLYRLDRENVRLAGKRVEIALPVGKRQEALKREPETNRLLKPRDGLVTFVLDCSVHDDVTVEHPNLETSIDGFTAKVSEVIFTPIQAYVTLDVGGDAGEAWAATLTPVDGDGAPVFTDAEMQSMYGFQGSGFGQAWYTFPYRERYPDALYLAPLNLFDEQADMSQAVRIK